MNIEPARHESLRELEKAVAAISSFNETHSFGALAVKAFGSFFGSLFRDDEPRITATPEQSATTMAEAIFNRYQSHLSRLGLQVDINRERSDVAELEFDHPEKLRTAETGQGLEIKTQRLDLTISDSHRLLEFFRSLKQADLSSPMAATTLDAISSELDRFIVRAYILEALDRGEGTNQQLYDVSTEIASELQRIGLKQASSVLTRHLEHIWQGDLREQLLAEKGKILPAEGFRPHTWHLDSQPEMYRQRWQKALDAFASVAENPRASGIFTEARSYLTDSLKIAEEHFATIERAGKSPEPMTRLIPEFREILSETRQRLADISRD